MGTDAFVVERGHDTLAGREVCESCLVRPECLDYAMADPEVQGTWGATSARQRAQIRMGRRAAS